MNKSIYHLKDNISTDVTILNLYEGREVASVITFADYLAFEGDNAQARISSSYSHKTK